MKITNVLDNILDYLQDYLKVSAVRGALLDMSQNGGTVTVSISQTQIRGIAKHKDGTETKLKTIDIKTKLG